MKNKIQIFIVLILIFNTAPLLAQSDYEEWLKKDQQKFDDYKTEQDKLFMQFLEDDWKQFQVFRGMKVDDTPKPTTIPKAEPQPLQQSNERWRILVTTIPDYISLLDMKDNFLFLNHYAEGFSEKDVIGTSVYNFLPQESRGVFEAAKKVCHETRQVQMFEHTAMGDHQKMMKYEGYAVPIIRQGHVDGTMIMSRDITERKKAEENLNKELSKRKILQDVAISLLETDLEKSLETSLKAIRIGLDLPKVMLRIRVDPNNDWQIVDCRESLLGIKSVLPTNIRGVDAILAYEKKEISVVNDIRKKYWYEKHKDIWEKTKTLAYLSIPCIDNSDDV